MTRGKRLRSLEELWDLEDSHPLQDASAAGLTRWMVATGIVAPLSRCSSSAPGRTPCPGPDPETPFLNGTGAEQES